MVAGSSVIHALVIGARDPVSLLRIADRMVYAFYGRRHGNKQFTNRRGLRLSNGPIRRLAGWRRRDDGARIDAAAYRSSWAFLRAAAALPSVKKMSFSPVGQT